MLLIPSLIRTQHCEKRQWLWRCDTKLRFEAAELMEFRWLVYISNFIQHNYCDEFYIHDDHKLTQSIFLVEMKQNLYYMFKWQHWNTCYMLLLSCMQTTQSVMNLTFFCKWNVYLHWWTLLHVYIL
jgi:hypothetical protein